MTETNALAVQGIDLNSLFRKAVEHSGKTRNAIAVELGVSRSAITRPYNGERVPSLDLVCRVADLAGLRVTVELKKRRASKE